MAYFVSVEKSFPLTENLFKCRVHWVFRFLTTE